MLSEQMDSPPFAKDWKQEFRSAVWLLGLFLLFASAAWAQRAAELAGTVTDSTGSLVPGANVAATNTATGVKSTSVTNEAGIYRFVEMVVGRYTIEVVRPGFKTHSTTVVLEAARTTTVNMALEVGELTQTVEVEAVAPTLDAESATVTNTVEETLIKNLPVTIRRPLQLVTVAAAVTFFGTEETTKPQNRNAILIAAAILVTPPIIQRLTGVALCGCRCDPDHPN